ncbi:MAG: hypothetical protein NVSMB22_05910 [Chloroflexota bacterium]
MYSDWLLGIVMDSLLTTEDVAEFFRLDVVTVRRMIGKGEIAAYRVGGEYRFRQTDIDDFLERQRLPMRPLGRGPLEKLTRRARKVPAGEAISESFDRFTDRAKKVLVYAQEEARNLDHSYLGTEHLLLGVLREGEGVGAILLRDVGCALETVRLEVRDLIGVGSPLDPDKCAMHLTPRLKKVLALAVDEAERLGHAYVGTEHLVLGLVREGEGVAGRNLQALGMDLEGSRVRVREILASKETR